MWAAFVVVIVIFNITRFLFVNYQFSFIKMNIRVNFALTWVSIGIWKSTYQVNVRHSELTNLGKRALISFSLTIHLH